MSRPCQRCRPYQQQRIERECPVQQAPQHQPHHIERPPQQPASSSSRFGVSGREGCGLVIFRAESVSWPPQGKEMPQGPWIFAPSVKNRLPADPPLTVVVLTVRPPPPAAHESVPLPAASVSTVP